MDSKQYGRIMVAFVVGAVVGIVGTLVLGRVTDLISREDSPFDSVSQVSEKLPIKVEPSVVFARLDQETETAWDMELFSGRVEQFGGRSIKKSAERIRGEAMVPPVAGGEVLGAFTNVFNADSVKRNGALHMVWFPRPDLTRDFLAAKPTIFSDEGLEEKRDTYWIGGFAVFYSPGEIDRTEGLRVFFKQMVLCSNNLGECELPADVKAFDDWAPRAGQ